MSQHYAPFDPREVLEPRTEIIPGLFMGMRPETYVGYDLVVCCERYLGSKPRDGYQGILVHYPMEDTDDFVLLDSVLWPIAEIIDAVMAREGRVLVHCTGGLNRSGVVVCRALQRVTGCPAKVALWTIRKMRDEWCVCNKQFERFLLGETLPTAGTSAFREEA